MAGIEDDVLAQLNKGKPAAEPAADEKPAEKAEAEAEAEAEKPHMTAGQVGSDGKKRIHVFGSQFQETYGPRPKKD